MDAQTKFQYLPCTTPFVAMALIEIAVTNVWNEKVDDLLLTIINVQPFIRVMIWIPN